MKKIPGLRKIEREFYKNITTKFLLGSETQEEASIKEYDFKLPKLKITQKRKIEAITELEKLNSPSHGTKKTHKTSSKGHLCCSLELWVPLSQVKLIQTTS